MALRVKGVNTVQSLAKRLRELPRTAAQDVATATAPYMTRETREAFGSGRTVYGEQRPRGVTGEALTLERTGAIKKALRFASEGTKIRAVLGPVDPRNGQRYGRFLIGKYNILPNGPIPAKWKEEIKSTFSKIAGVKLGL